MFLIFKSSSGTSVVPDYTKIGKLYLDYLKKLKDDFVRVFGRSLTL